MELFTLRLIIVYQIEKVRNYNTYWHCVIKKFDEIFCQMILYKIKFKLNKCITLGSK